jgi:DNA-binding PadR family transcriptional regulator
VLAAIQNKDTYGYQIIKDMKPFVEISESTLYPILRRLENSLLRKPSAATSISSCDNNSPGSYEPGLL